MSQIFLNDDDVVSMEAGQNFTKTTTSKIKEVKNALISEKLSGFGNWISDGVQCQILLANRLGWYKGKIRLRIEFVPANPEDFADRTTLTNYPSENPSPLDDLRSDLNI